MQQRRWEIEAELRKGFDVPDTFQQAERKPMFRRPPPVPKLPGASEKPSPLKSSPTLPPINTPSPAKQAAPDPFQRPGGWRKPWQPRSAEDSEVTPPAPPPMHIPEMPKDSRPRVSLRGVKEAREEQRRIDRNRDEIIRQRKAENVQHRHQEEEEWESDIRKRFKEERGHIDAHRRQNVEAEAELRARSKSFEAEAETRRAEAEAQRAEVEARRAEAAAAEAQSQAERVRRRMEQQARYWNTEPTAEQCEPESPKGEEQHARHRRRHAKRQGNAADEPRMSPRGAAYMHRELNKSSTLTGSRKVTVVPQEEVLKQAEGAAMQQLAALRHLQTKKERQKGFKELLRAWHPDKNPQNLEVATAVFQRLQAERFRALGA